MTRTVLPLMVSLGFLALSGCLLQSGSDTPANTAVNIRPNELEGGPLPVIPDPGTTAVPPVVPMPNTVRFIAMGDSGSGKKGQIATGDAMRQVCLDMGKVGQPAGLSDEAYIMLGCQFVLGFGDNIYETGVNRVDDPLFFDNFEKAYLTLPAQMKFYMALGNHDNTGFLGYASQQQAAGIDTDYRRGDYQVAYTTQAVDSTGRNALNPKKTSRWQMPSRYYDFTAGGSSGAPLVHFFAIDAITATSTLPDANGKYAYDTYGQQQLLWLKNGLRNSPAKFKVTFAHHPYLSNGSHGNAGAYEGLPNQLAPVASGQRYKDFLEEAMCDVSDMLMTGHDHDLQWLTSVPACGRTEFLLSGAAGKNDRDLKSPDGNTVRIQRGLRLGFYWVEISINPLTTQPQMKADLYSVTEDTNGSQRVQAKKIDGSDDGAPIAYNFRREDPLVGPTMAQAARRDAYLTRTGQSNVSVLQQKPRENPVFSGRTTTDPSYSCSAGSQSSVMAGNRPGLLDPVQASLNGLITAAVSSTSDRTTKQLISALGNALISTVEVADQVAVTGLETRNIQGDTFAAAKQQEALNLAVARTVRVVQDLRTALPAGVLPAPFKDLPAAVLLSTRLAGSSNCQSGRLSGIVLPVAGLTDTLAKQAEAGRNMTGNAPVVAGVAQALVDALNNLTQLFVNIGTERPSLVNDRIFATVDGLLRSVVTDVLPLESAFANNAPVGYTPTAVIGLAESPLKAVAQEAAFNLERGLASTPP